LSGSRRHRVSEERNKSNNRNIKEEDSGEAKDTSNGRKKEREQTEQVKLIAESTMVHFNGEARHEWPEFVKELFAMGADEGGWEQALEMQLDLGVVTNKKLNKMAWCYLTIMLEGSALDEMDMVPDKNAYEVWQHLKETYEPRGGKANDYLQMKLVKCELESHKKVNGFWEINIVDADKHGDEDEEACATFGSNSGDGVQSEQRIKEKRQFSFQFHQEKNQHQQHGVEKVIVETSDQMVVPNGMMGKGKKHTIMEDSMSEKVMLQSKENQIEQQEGRHGKRHKEDNTNGIDLWEENVEAGKWGVNKRKAEHHEPVVKDEERENPIREESNKEHEELSVELREKDGEENGYDKHVKENHEEFSVEPMEHEDVDVKDGFEMIQVEMKEKMKKMMPKMARNIRLGRKKSRIMMLRVETNV